MWSIPSADLLTFVIGLNSPWQLMFGWLVMIAAMMVPMLGEQLVQVIQRSPKGRRFALVLVLLTGFVLIWSLAGALLIGLSIALRLAFASHTVAILVVLAIAGIWHASPTKQIALNMCHRDPTFTTFGPKALWDCFRLGLRAGVWCLVSCWAIMLLALMIPAFHLTAMILASLVVWTERCERPYPPQWSCVRPFASHPGQKSSPVGM
jgi:predicted metal-binding membrane protein